jgi:hypothetical protein
MVVIRIITIGRIYLGGERTTSARIVSSNCISSVVYCRAHLDLMANMGIFYFFGSTLTSEVLFYTVIEG